MKRRIAQVAPCVGAGRRITPSANPPYESANFLLVLEFVFFVDLVVPAPMRCGLLRPQRSRDIRFARGGGVARAGAGRDLLARDRLRLADDAPRGAAHQVDVDVIVMID